MSAAHLMSYPAATPDGHHRARPRLQCDDLGLDEPTSALDLANQAAVLGLTMWLTHERKFTVIFTTHQPQHAFAVADRGDAYDGRATGNISGAASFDVMNEENLTRLYGVDVGRVCFERHGIATEAVLPILEFRSRTII